MATRSSIFAGLVWTSILFRASETAGYLTLFPCGPDNVVEVVEGGPDTTITCNGIGAEDNVGWALNYQTYSGEGRHILGICSVIPANGSSQCTDIDLPYFTPSRPSDTSTSITVEPTKAKNVKIFGTSTLVCESPANKINSQRKSCQMDYVYPAQANCSVELTRNPNSTWSLNGQCNVTKAYSSRGRYGCHWHLIKRSSQEIPLGFNVNYTTRRVSEGTFVSGSCSLSTFQVDISRDEVPAWYKVVITPGDVIVIGTLAYLEPVAIAIHSNKTAVTVDCRADGRPAPFLRLTESDTDKELASGPSPLSFSLSMSGAECQHPVTFTCTASNRLGQDMSSSAVLMNTCMVGSPPPEATDSQLPEVVAKASTMEENPRVGTTVSAGGLALGAGVMLALTVVVLLIRRCARRPLRAKTATVRGCCGRKKTFTASAYPPSERDDGPNYPCLHRSDQETQLGPTEWILSENYDVVNKFDIGMTESYDTCNPYAFISELNGNEYCIPRQVGTTFGITRAPADQTNLKETAFIGE